MLNIPAVLLAFIYGGIITGFVTFLIMRRMIRLLRSEVDRARHERQTNFYRYGYVEGYKDARQEFLKSSVATKGTIFLSKDSLSKQS